MHHNLALVLEIDRDTGADDRLDLAQPPAWFKLMANDGADFEECMRHGRDLPDPAGRHQRKRQQNCPGDLR